MANKKISELPYINAGKISGNTLVPLVTYYSAATGDTVHTYITDLQNYLTSGITGNTVVGDFLPLSGGTVSGGTIFSTNGGTRLSIDTDVRALYDAGNGVSIDWEYRNLVNSTGTKTVDYESNLLLDVTGGTSVNWQNRRLTDDLGIDSADWTSSKRILYDNSGLSSIDWKNRLLTDSSSIIRVQWSASRLNDASGTQSMRWDLRRMYDNSGLTSIDYTGRKLFRSTGGTSFDWENGILTGQTNIQSSTISATTYQNLPTDVRVTGGTYSAGTITFTNNTGGTFNVTGLTTGSTSTISGDYLPLSGGTVSGTTYFTQGVSGSTVSATTFNFNTGFTGSTLVGQMTWNQDFGVPQVGMVGGNVVQKVGENVFAYVKNVETSTLTKGEVVYIFGASGDKMSVKRASNTGDTTSAKTLGIVAESIAVNGLGYVITQGTIDGLNLGSYTAGDLVWLSNTPGQFTKTKQYAPYHLVFVGVVQRANAGNGQLYVKPQNGYELEEIHDVIATGATYGDILVYSAYGSNDVWVSTKTLNGSYTITGNTNIGGNLTVSGNSGINWFSSNTSSDLVRITQTGVGNAFVVEDNTNPDSTPFIINSGGSVSVGTTSVFSVGGGTETKLNVSTGSSGVATTGLSVSTPVIIESTVGTSIGLLNPDVANSQIYFGTPSDAFGSYLRWDYTNRNLILSTANGTGKLIFQTANSVESARIDQSGNMGIGLTGATQKLEVSGNTRIYGSMSAQTGYISGSGQNILTVIGSGNSTTSPLFSVQGSSGELFSVSDSLVGSLFSVNDISGLPILETFSDNTTLWGSYQAPSLNTTTRTSLSAGTNTIYSIPTSAYTGAFYEYTLISTGTTGARAGQIMSIWSGTTANFTETTTTDIGTTTGVTFNVAVSGNNAVLSSSATTAGWTLKTIVRSI